MHEHTSSLLIIATFTPTHPTDEVIQIATLAAISSLIFGSAISSVLCLCIRRHCGHMKATSNGQTEGTEWHPRAEKESGSQIQLQNNALYELVNTKVNT